MFLLQSIISQGIKAKTEFDVSVITGAIKTYNNKHSITCVVLMFLLQSINSRGIQAKIEYNVSIITGPIQKCNNKHSMTCVVLMFLLYSIISQGIWENGIWCISHHWPDSKIQQKHLIACGVDVFFVFFCNRSSREGYRPKRNLMYQSLQARLKNTTINIQ